MQYFNFHSVIFAHCRKCSTTISKVWLRCQQISCLRQEFWKRKSVASQRFSSSSSSCVASKQSTGCQQMQGCSFTATSAITPWLPTHSACCKRAVHQPNPKKKKKIHPSWIVSVLFQLLEKQIIHVSWGGNYHHLHRPCLHPSSMGENLPFACAGSSFFGFFLVLM